MVMAPDPTEVPIAFATSLAPTPHAIKKAKQQAMTNSKKPYCEIISIAKLVFVKLVNG
jgi:hypothetical protein